MAIGLLLQVAVLTFIDSNLFLMLLWDHLLFTVFQVAIALI